MTSGGVDEPRDANETMAPSNAPATTVRPKPPRPKLRDVARSLGVSITTVSNAFNRPDQLSPKLRTIVLERAEQLGYRGPGAEGRLLRTGHAGAVAFYVPKPMGYLLDDPFACTFLAALTDACQERQIGLVLLPGVPHSASDHPRPPAALDIAAVDAIILYALASDDPVIERALARGRPVVGIDMTERDEMIHVGTDDRGGARAAARHLIERGHRRFAVIALPPDRKRSDREGTAEELARATIPYPAGRWAGYAAAFGEAGIDPKSVPIRIAAANGRENGHAAMHAILDMAEDRPATAEPRTAVLVMSDVLVRGAMDACAERGLSVPDDIAIVGFDDAPFAEGMGLTTVAQDAGAKARLALQCALGEMKGTVLPTQFVVRTSSG